MYHGDAFSIVRRDGLWIIYRLFGVDEREEIALTTAAMDEMDSYFSEFYAEDRAEVVSSGP